MFVMQKLTSCCGDEKLVFIWPGWFNPTVWLQPTNEISTDEEMTAEELEESADGSFFGSGQSWEKDSVSLSGANSFQLNKTVCDVKRSFYTAVNHTRKLVSVEQAVCGAWTEIVRCHLIW